MACPLKSVSCWLVIAFVFLHLTSCITPFPIIYTYFAPQATGGELERSICAGGAGPKDVLVTALNSAIKLIVHAKVNNKKYRNLVIFDLKIVIPKGHIVQMSSRDFEILDNDRNIVYQHEHTNELRGRALRTGYPDTHHGILESLHGDTIKSIFVNGVKIVVTDKMAEDYSKVRKTHRSYVFSFSKPYSKDFILRVPPIYADGVKHHIPEIRFIETSGAFIMPLNC